MEYSNLIDKFKIQGNKITFFDKYGEGHINETYLLIMDDTYQYILQKINNHIFLDVDLLMWNIEKVTSFLSNKINQSGGDSTRETLNIVYTKDNKSFYHDIDTDSYYRIYLFVKDSVTLQKCSSAELFAYSAIGFANFAKQLEDFDASTLGEVIQNFHNTKKRFEHFKNTLARDPLNRAKDVKEEIDFILKREKDCSIIVDALEKHLIPLHVTHNDTKLNNVLFDKKTMKPLCVIDLDTVMPGSILYDFGDSIRYGCNPAGEAERDLSKVVFNLDYFKAYVDAYLSTLGDSISQKEKELLPFSGKLMTLECGIRFLDDYLDGDHYFRISKSDDNLARARTQFKLVMDMESLMDEMNLYVGNK